MFNLSYGYWVKLRTCLHGNFKVFWTVLFCVRILLCVKHLITIQTLNHIKLECSNIVSKTALTILSSMQNTLRNINTKFGSNCSSSIREEKYHIYTLLPEFTFSIGLGTPTISHSWFLIGLTSSKSLSLQVYKLKLIIVNDF